MLAVLSEYLLASPGITKLFSLSQLLRYASVFKALNVNKKGSLQVSNLHIYIFLNITNFMPSAHMITTELHFVNTRNVEWLIAVGKKFTYARSPDHSLVQSVERVGLHIK